MTISRAATSVAAHDAASTRLRAGRVRRGDRAGWTSRSSSIDDQCTMTSSYAGLDAPMGWTTTDRSLVRPVNPSRRSAVIPANADPGAEASRATMSRSSSVSRPLCVTYTPRYGLCHTFRLIRLRMRDRVMLRSASRYVSTVSWRVTDMCRSDRLAAHVARVHVSHRGRTPTEATLWLAEESPWRLLADHHCDSCVDTAGRDFVRPARLWQDGPSAQDGSATGDPPMSAETSPHVNIRG